MTLHADSAKRPKPGEIASFAVLGARMTWAILGPMVLLLTISGIVSRGGGWFTGLDAIFAIVVGLMMLGRRVEQRSGSATTLRGEPATIVQGQRYTAVLLLVAPATWIAAKVTGSHLLP